MEKFTLILEKIEFILILLLVSVLLSFCITLVLGYFVSFDINSFNTTIFCFVLPVFLALSVLVYREHKDTFND